jgi:peptidoglycan-N-acetylmuramic acid deacetylase
VCFFAGNVFPRKKHWGHCFRTASSAGDEHPGDGGECIGEYSGTALRGELGTGIRLGRNAASGTASSDKLKEYNAYYVGDAGEKKIYLTFDCGYENGNTSQILDALKKHDAPATFFVVGHFLESAPEMVKRMVEEGHTVGNHTYHHYDMSKISDPAVFQKEMDDVRTLFQETTGTEMAMYYRPPQGKYSETNLQMAKDLGYSTFFWSLA